MHGGNGGTGDTTSIGNMGNMNEHDCHCDHVAKLFVDMNTVHLDIVKSRPPEHHLSRPAFNEVVRDIRAALQIAATAAAQTHFSGPHRIQ